MHGIRLIITTFILLWIPIQKLEKLVCGVMRKIMGIEE